MDTFIYKDALKTYQPIEIIKLDIDNIYFDNNEKLITIEMTIGDEKLKRSFGVGNEDSFYRFFDPDVCGIIFDKEINGTIYSIFITSPQLSGLLSKSNSALKDKKTNINNVNCWYVEIIKSFNDFTIYFIRASVKDEFSYDLRRSQSYYYFRNTYHSIPDENNQVENYLKIQFPNGVETIVKIKSCVVNVLPINELKTLFIGKLSLGSVKGFLLLLPIDTLLDIQMMNHFDKDLRILFDNHYIPIPGLPRILKDLSEKYNLREHYSENIDRSHILSLSFPIEEVLNNDPSINNPEQINFNDLILLSERGYEPYYDHSELYKEDELPIRQILYEGGNILSDLPDYDYNRNKEQAGQDNIYNPIEDQPIDDEWEGLNLDEKIHYDPDRALDNMEGNRYEDDKLSAGNIIDEKNIEHWGRWESDNNNILNSIYVISLSSSEIEFEIQKELSYYRNKITRIERLPLVKGLDVFTGMLKYITEYISSGELVIPFVVIENVNDEISQQIVVDLLGYKKFRLVKSKYFDIYFNADYERYFSLGVI